MALLTSYFCKIFNHRDMLALCYAFDTARINVQLLLPTNNVLRCWNVSNGPFLDRTGWWKAVRSFLEVNTTLLNEEGQLFIGCWECSKCCNCFRDRLSGTVSVLFTKVYVNVRVRGICMYLLLTLNLFQILHFVFFAFLKDNALLSFIY